MIYFKLLNYITYFTYDNNIHKHYPKIKYHTICTIEES